MTDPNYWLMKHVPVVIERDFQPKCGVTRNGKSGWNSEFCIRDVSYAKGICPVAEKLNDKTYLGFEMCLFELLDEDLENIIKAFNKVWSNLEEL